MTEPTKLSVDHELPQVQELVPVDPAPEPEPEPAPLTFEPDYVVVERDQVDEYANKGYRPGYVMLRP